MSSFTACNQTVKEGEDIAKRTTEEMKGSTNSSKNSKLKIETYRLAKGNVEKTVFIPTISVTNNTDKAINLANNFKVEGYQNGTLLIDANTDVIDEKFNQMDLTNPIDPNESHDYEWAWYLNDMSDVTVKITEKSNNNMTEAILSIKDEKTP